MDTNDSVDGLQCSIEGGYGVIDLLEITVEVKMQRAEDEAARRDMENDRYGQCCDLRAKADAEAENDAFIEWVEREQVRQNWRKWKSCCRRARWLRDSWTQVSIEVGYGAIDLRELVVEAERLFSYAIGIMGSDIVVWLPRPEDREYPQETDEELFMEARYPTDEDEQEILM